MNHDEWSDIDELVYQRGLDGQALSDYLNYANDLYDLDEDDEDLEVVAAAQYEDKAIIQDRQGKYGKAIINFDDAVKSLKKAERFLDPIAQEDREALEDYLNEWQHRIKILQSFRKDKTKQAIIDFLKSRSSSSNGDIWKHIQDDDETRVSLKMFNNYLLELVQAKEVVKKKGDKPGRKNPRYSLATIAPFISFTGMPEADGSIKTGVQWWVGWIEDRLERINRDVKEFKEPESLAERIHFVYSIIIQLQHRQKIMQEISKRKSFSTKDGLSDKDMLNVWELMIGHLFEILNKLPKKKQQEILKKIRDLSEGGFVKILEKHNSPEIAEFEDIDPPRYNG